MNSPRRSSLTKPQRLAAARTRADQAGVAAFRVLNAKLIVRLQCRAVGEVSANAPEQVLAPSTPRGLRLLCLLVQTRTGETRSLPVHTLHRVPPYTGLRGRYHDGAGRWSVAFDPLDVPGGAGFYLRETHARPPSPEVLARCLRQRQAHTFRAHSPAIRVGGLNSGH